MMIQILHLVNAFDIGGMENGVMNIINHSDPSRFQHAVCSLTTVGKMKERVVRPARYYALESTDVNRWLFLKIRHVIKESHPDIIHVRGWGPLFDTLLSLTFLWPRPPVIFSFHGISYWEYITRKIFRDALKSTLLTKVDLVMTLNQNMRSYLAARYHIHEKKIMVIGNGIDLALYSYPGIEGTNKQTLRQSFHLEADDFVLGAVSRLDKIKNLPFLIQASQSLIPSIPHLKVLIVGDGPELTGLQQLVKQLELEQHVLFLGKQENMHRIYPLMDIFIHPAFYEGFSNTILEAMASGLPVICSNVGGNACLMDHGSNGYLFELNNINEFTGYVMELYTNLERRRNFSRQSRQMVEEKWTIEMMVNAYETMYATLYEKRNK